MEVKDSTNNTEAEKSNANEKANLSGNNALNTILANAKPIGIALLILIVLVKLFSLGSSPATTTQIKTEKSGEDLVQKSEEMEKTEKLSSLPSVKDDFQFAVEHLKNFFKENGFETSVFRLTDVFEYYITPAQEANGLQQAKRLAVRFAIKTESDQQWFDLSSLKGQSWQPVTANQKHGGCPEDCGKDVFFDLTVWNGKRQIDFTYKNMKDSLLDAFEFHKKNGFK